MWRDPWEPLEVISLLERSSSHFISENGMISDTSRAPWYPCLCFSWATKWAQKVWNGADGSNSVTAKGINFLHGCVWWFDPGQMPGTCQSSSLTPLQSWIGERDCNGGGFMSWGKDWERPLIKHQRQNRLQLEVWIEFITLTKSGQDYEKK